MRADRLDMAGNLAVAVAAAPNRVIWVRDGAQVSGQPAAQICADPGPKMPNVQGKVL